MPDSSGRQIRHLSWWGRVDSNHRRHCQQIYSLSPLATREHPHMRFTHQGKDGAGRRIRTPDLLITNQLLYRLSYTSRKSSEGYNSKSDHICQHQNKSFPAADVGLSMMCYREGKEERTSLGERQLRGRMGKSLYFLFQTASCFWKSSKEKNLCEA